MFESQLRFIDLLRSGNEYEYRIRYFVVEIEKVKKKERVFVSSKQLLTTAKFLKLSKIQIR